MKIFSPNKQYSGVSASVTFVNGQGETDNPHLIKWFKAHGYKVEAEEKKPEEPKKPSRRSSRSEKNQKQEDSGQDFSGMDDDMLRAYAEENGIDLEGISSREEIIEKLNESSAE